MILTLILPSNVLVVARLIGPSAQMTTTNDILAGCENLDYKSNVVEGVRVAYLRRVALDGVH